MSERKAKPLRADLITCISVTVCGLNLHRSYLPDALWTRLFPVLAILGGLLCILALFLDITKGTEEELEREAQDERNLMIQDRASWFCWRAENVLLIVAWAGLILFMRQDFTNHALYWMSYVLYWVIILRYWFFFVTRWWLNRKY